ncbi:MAG: hypothetical protein KDA93_09530 [Planctomycetaceae bacterium]|nr:hypothetical protein [Planctomycetaceae bacterium]
MRLEKSVVRFFTRAMTLTLALVVCTALPVAALACPFCSAPSLTLSEQVAQADVSVLVQWAKGKQGDSEAGDVGSTTYKIVEVMNAGDQSLAKGDDIELPRYRSGKEGDLFLLLGTKGTELEWGSPIEITETGFNYVRQAPSPEAAALVRLTYFVQFLEYPDELISNDAYAEFANAPYKDIVPLANELPREQVREWLEDDDVAPTRLGLYGMLLGLCGNSEDAALMKEMILHTTNDFRLGIDGVMGGYLLLTGEEGLAVIDEHKLANRDVAFSETYAAMQALRFMWTYGDRIDKERLRESMRILLDRAELADLVIADLARWEDWSIIDRLMKLYGAEGYEIPSIKRAIVRYMLVASKNKPEDGQDDLHVAKAEEYLNQLREQDPKTVQQAERFFFVN